MTLRAYLITLRGRIREALVPELQELRDRATIAEQNALNGRTSARAIQAEAGAREWQAIADAAVKRAGALAPDARRGRYLLAKMRHLQYGQNEGWTLTELYPGADPASAVDAAMAKSDGRGAA